jgi:hypothetical protein
MHRAKEIIEAGEKVAEAALPKVKALLPYFAGRADAGATVFDLLQPATSGVRVA